MLKVDISGAYIGDCKNGLAHGKGIARGENSYEGEFKKGLPTGSVHFADGAKYSGQWENGLRQGEGNFTIRIKGKDSIADSIWINDKYVGKKPVVPCEAVKKYLYRGTLLEK